MSHTTQARGRLPTSNSGHQNPAMNKKPAQETVSAAAPQTGSDHPPPGSPCSLTEGLQDRLGCNKENIRAQASTQPVLNRVFQPDGNNLGNKRLLAHRQSSAMMSRTITGPKGRINSCQAKVEPVQDKFRKTLPDSKSTSQKPSVKTQPLQPPPLLTVSTNLLHKKPGANQEKTNLARQPVGKLLSVLPGGSLKHHSRPPQMKRSPVKPAASSRPQGTTNPKPSLKPCGPTQRQRPAANGEVGRKDVKVVPAGRPAASRATVPQNQPHSSKTQAIKSDFTSRKDRLKSELPKASGIQARRVPKTPSAADHILFLPKQQKLARGEIAREKSSLASGGGLLGWLTVIPWSFDRKQLEEWLASKGKTYKRPPMTLLQKKPVKLSWRNVKVEEKQEKPEQLCLEKINNILTECLKLVEEGVETEELSAVLSQVPQAEKFAKFWICKAKLLARSGPFDVTGLYKAAVCAGAVPLQELREVVLDILKATDKTSEGNMFTSYVCSQVRLSCPLLAASTLWASSPLQDLPKNSCPFHRRKELLEGPELKFLTPVRRSLRIERAGSCYPEMLKDHDPVVSSLREILDVEEQTQFFFRKNKALPEVAELEGLSVYPPECC
uniref:Cytoskeleton-associated protein 2 C-terminal domain-containing protein n=1 Tax=Strix occidentalis caurina TaxID=311401 RepID=A0A8D0F7Q9_STROC